VNSETFLNESQELILLLFDKSLIILLPRTSKNHTNFMQITILILI